MTWSSVEAKFHALAEPFVNELLRNQLVAVVRKLEKLQATDLLKLLAKIPKRSGGRSP